MDGWIITGTTMEFDATMLMLSAPIMALAA